jgi:predicted AAA+ superfamily ATPase
MSKTIDLILERISVNRIGQSSLHKQIQEIELCCKNRAQAAGVEGKASDITGPEEITIDGLQRYKYTFTLTLKKEKYRSENTAIKHLEAGKKFVIRAAESRNWLVKADSREQANIEAAQEGRGTLLYEPLTPDIMNDYFKDIYEREPHIRMIHRSTRNFIESQKEERNHTLLYGEPSACKSELLKRFKRWYDDDCERVAMINSTTLSKAGLENWLLDKAKTKLLPEILWFDEIEKFSNENDLSCLLALMDGQGKIAKLNAVIGKQEEEAKVLVWGTCNDADKLKRWNAGALWSRFTKKFECVRPSREVMTDILLRKIDQRREQGRPANNAWAKVCIEYAFDKVRNNDPRFVAGLLEGEDELLDGSYFRDMEDIEKAARKGKAK